MDWIWINSCYPQGLKVWWWHYVLGGKRDHGSQEDKSLNVWFFLDKNNSFKCFFLKPSLQEHQKKHFGKDDGLGWERKDSRSWPYSSRARCTRQFGIFTIKSSSKQTCTKLMVGQSYNLLTNAFSTKFLLFLRPARQGLWCWSFWQSTWTKRSVRERICQGFAASRFPRTWIKSCPAKCDYQSLEWDAKTGAEDLGA